MCGIAGILNLDGEAVDPALLARMISLQHHRGPDDRGIHMFSLLQGTARPFTNNWSGSSTNYEGGIAFSRLSILDLSERGHQPMVSDDENVIIAFNGEIYNSVQLKPQLIAAGHRFRGTSDTEVLMRLYIQYGLNRLLDLIEGMFAVAIIDLRDRTLTLIRDRIGIKPILWSRMGNTILFGSEIKSFLSHPRFKTELNESHLDEYMAFRYCAGEGHLLKGVYPLRPGRYVRFTIGAAPIERRYYSIPDQQQRVQDVEAIDQLEERLKASVSSQMIADVTVGCQLSGGVDSSLITLYANMHRRGAIEAFSIVLGDTPLSEEKWIDEAAEVVGVPANKYLMDSSTFFNNLRSATWHLEQPVNHPNTVGIKLLAEKSSSSVKVLLSGEGADELMGGYNRFYHAQIRPRFGGLSNLLGRAPVIGERWSRNMRPDLRDHVDFFISSSMHMQPAQLASLRPQSDIATVLARRREIFKEGDGTFLSQCSKYEMQTHLVDLLLRQDRMMMAHSVEGRVPFLDRDLIHLARNLPDHLLVDNRICYRDSRSHRTKVALKMLSRRYFSDHFVFRPKSGFTLPLLSYYRDGSFQTLMEDLILPGIRRRGLFDFKPIEHWWNYLESMPRTLDETFWIPIMFEFWAQQWIDGSGDQSACRFDRSDLSALSGKGFA